MSKHWHVEEMWVVAWITPDGVEKIHLITNSSVSADLAALELLGTHRAFTKRRHVLTDGEKAILLPKALLVDFKDPQA